MPLVRGFLNKVNPWHEDQLTPPPPPITTTSAVVLLVLYALVYLLPFYASRTTRPAPDLSRDAPSVVRARIRSVTLSCVVCCLSTYLILRQADGATAAAALHMMGLWPLAVVDSLRALLLTAVLFAGPLFSYLVVDRGAHEWLKLQPLAELWNEWTTWRNIIAGPFTEEVLFRSASVPLMLIARASVRQTVFLSPVVFGLAHIHHFYEFRLTNPGVPFAAALLRSLFQLAFTTIFGAYATFVYLRTGSLLAVFAIHAFCNAMGLPRLWGRLQPAPIPGRPISESAGKGLRRTVVYYVILVSGAVLWYRELWAWSESGNALVPVR